jgi:hypothetical protein
MIIERLQRIDEAAKRLNRQSVDEKNFVAFLQQEALNDRFPQGDQK